MTVCPEDFLNRNDKFGMAYSMEGRYPLASKTFMQYCMAIPSTEKLSKFQLKSMSRRAYKGHLPDYIINKIEEMQKELNLQNLKVWSNFPEVKHEDCMKSIKLFTEKIIPHFKSKNNSKIKAAS